MLTRWLLACYRAAVLIGHITGPARPFGLSVRHVRARSLETKMRRKAKTRRERSARQE